MTGWPADTGSTFDGTLAFDGGQVDTGCPRCGTDAYDHLCPIDALPTLPIRPLVDRSAPFRLDEAAGVLVQGPWRHPLRLTPDGSGAVAVHDGIAYAKDGAIVHITLQSTR